MRKTYFFFLWVFSIGSMPSLYAQIRFSRLEKIIPLYKWTDSVPQGEMRQVFVPDGNLWQKHIIDTVSFGQFEFSQRILASERVKESRAALWKNEEKFRTFDTVFQPALYGIFLYAKDGQYGLISAEGKELSNLYDRMAFLYYRWQGRWVVGPVFLVEKNRQYALMDANGFAITRFCRDAGELPRAFVLDAANGFKLDQTVRPESLWGY